MKYDPEERCIECGTPSLAEEEIVRLTARVADLEILLLESCNYITCAFPTKCDTAFVNETLKRANLK